MYIFIFNERIEEKPYNLFLIKYWIESIKSQFDALMLTRELVSLSAGHC